MAKKITFLLLALLLLGVIGVAAIAWNINPILESFRPEVTRMVSAAIKQPVVIGKISLRFLPSLAVEIAELSLPPSSDGTASDAQLKDISIEADVRALLKRQLNVESINVGSLRLVVSREANGSLRVGGKELAAAEPPPENAAENPTSNGEEKPTIILNVKNASITSGTLVWEDRSVSPPQTLGIENLNMAVKGISLQGIDRLNIGATFLGKEKNNFGIEGKVLQGGSGPIPATVDVSLHWNAIDFPVLVKALNAYGIAPKSVDLEEQASVQMRLNSTASGIGIDSTINLTKAALNVPGSLKKAAGVPFVVLLKGHGNLGEVALEKLDITLGRDEVSLPLSYSLADGLLKLSLRSKSINLAEAAGLIPALTPFQPQGNLVPNINAVIQVQQGGLKELGGNVELRQASLAFGEKPTTISNINGKAELHPNEVILKPISLTLMGQQIDLGARITEWEQPKFQLAAKGVFGGIIKLDGSRPTSTQLQTNIRVEGLTIGDLLKTINPDGKPQVIGTMESLTANLSGNPSDFGSTKSGPVNTILVKGAFPGVNILAKALDKISVIPGLGVSLLQNVPEQFRGVVASESTEFDRLTVNAKFQGKNIQLDNLELTHPVYGIAGSGQISGNGDLKINARLKLTPSVAEDMVLRQPKLKLLLERGGEISFPLVITRSNGVFLVIPDASGLAKLAVQNTATEAAGRALDKVAPGLGKGLGGAIDSLFK